MVMRSPHIPADRWVGNLLEAAELIANRQYQETRWLAADAHAWETPEEAINALDDCVLDGFIVQFAESFSPSQYEAVIAFRDAVHHWCVATPQHLEPSGVLTDHDWEMVRARASEFVRTFKGSWPNPEA